MQEPKLTSRIPLTLSYDLSELDKKIDSVDATIKNFLEENEITQFVEET